jgi:hypothetical protein
MSLGRYHRVPIKHRKAARNEIKECFTAHKTRKDRANRLLFLHATISVLSSYSDALFFRVHKQKLISYNTHDTDVKASERQANGLSRRGA